MEFELNLNKNYSKFNMFVFEYLNFVFEYGGGEG